MLDKGEISFQRATVSIMKYFRETVKKEYVTWQGEKQKRHCFCILKDMFWFRKKTEKPSTTVGIGIIKIKAIFV